MTDLRPTRKPLVSALALLLVSSAAFAAAPMDAPRLQASAAGVRIMPAIDAPAWQLRVIAPDGRAFEDTLLAEEPLLVSPKAFGHAAWSDGGYRYEIVPVLGVRTRADTEAANAPGVDAALATGGTFQVLGGVMYLPGVGDAEPAAPTPKRTLAAGTVQPLDVVTPDDSIVQGSLCVGFDCVNNESFGFDTLRLKENNTRIKFEDTSVDTYPSNDWQLTANDSASGGANKFSIEDVSGAKVPFTITAGAATNSLFVDSTGRVGFRTSTPVLDLHMNTSNTPAVRFEQNASGGWGAQTWDIGANEANFFVRDVTGGSKLSLRIRPGAPTSSLDIAANGDVGMGTASPKSALHVVRNGNAALKLQTTTGSNTTWEVNLNSATGRLNFSDDTTYGRIPIKFAPGAANNLFRIGMPNSTTVEVNGTLAVNGDIEVTGTVGPDYVFAPGYALPSIAEHADYMQANRHLPKVGPTRVDVGGRGVMSLGALSHGMLEELEVAHLYIADLDRTVDELQRKLDGRDAELEALREEVQAIRSALDASH